MTSLWVKLRDALESECETLHTLLSPLEEELKPVAGQDLREIADAGIAAAAAALTATGGITLTALETAAIAGGRAALAAAKTKGVALSEQAALSLATLAGLKTPQQ